MSFQDRHIADVPAVQVVEFRGEKITGEFHSSAEGYVATIFFRNGTKISISKPNPQRLKEAIQQKDPSVRFFAKSVMPTTQQRDYERKQMQKETGTTGGVRPQRGNDRWNVPVQSNEPIPLSGQHPFPAASDIKPISFSGTKIFGAYFPKENHFEGWLAQKGSGSAKQTFSCNTVRELIEELEKINGGRLAFDTPPMLQPIESQPIELTNMDAALAEVWILWRRTNDYFASPYNLELFKKYAELYGIPFPCVSLEDYDRIYQTAQAKPALGEFERRKCGQPAPRETTTQPSVSYSRPQAPVLSESEMRTMPVEELARLAEIDRQRRKRTKETDTELKKKLIQSF